MEETHPSARCCPHAGDPSSNPIYGWESEQADMGRSSGGRLCAKARRIIGRNSECRGDETIDYEERYRRMDYGDDHTRIYSETD